MFVTVALPAERVETGVFRGRWGLILLMSESYLRLQGGSLTCPIIQLMAKRERDGEKPQERRMQPLALKTNEPSLLSECSTCGRITSWTQKRVYLTFCWINQSPSFQNQSKQTEYLQAWTVHSHCISFFIDCLFWFKNTSDLKPSYMLVVLREFSMDL